MSDAGAITAPGHNPSSVGIGAALRQHPFLYDPSKFRKVLESLSRLFCEDEEIVLLDVLATEEKGFTERDLVDRLGWSEKRLREVLVGLECRLLVVKEQLSSLSYSVIQNAITGGVVGYGGLRGQHASSTELLVVSGDSTNASTTNSAINGMSTNLLNTVGGISSSLPAADTSSTYHAAAAAAAASSSSLSSGSAGPSSFTKDRAMPPSLSTPNYWRINEHVITVLQWQLAKFDQMLSAKLKQAQCGDDFVCPNCSKFYSSLDAQTLDIHPEDAHFLCATCGERLKQQDNKSLRVEAESQMRRAHQQLQIFRSAVEAAADMEVPIFPPFTRAQKNDLKKEMAKDSNASGGSVVGGEGEGDSCSAGDTAGSYNAQFKLHLKQTGADSTVPRKEVPEWFSGAQQGTVRSSGSTSKPLLGYVDKRPPPVGRGCPSDKREGRDHQMTAGGGGGGAAAGKGGMVPFCCSRSSIGVRRDAAAALLAMSRKPGGGGGGGEIIRRTPPPGASVVKPAAAAVGDNTASDLGSRNSGGTKMPIRFSMKTSSVVGARGGGRGNRGGGSSK